jgi:two-component system response regulator PilR (NtrC family)
VRELRNVIERAFVVCDGDVIVAEDLPSKLREPRTGTNSPVATRSQAPGAFASSMPPAFPRAPEGALPPGSVRDRLKQDELTAIRAALEETQGNRRLAAERLGMPIRTLERRIREHGLGKSKT